MQTVVEEQVRLALKVVPHFDRVDAFLEAKSFQPVVGVQRFSLECAFRLDPRKNS